MKRIKIILLLIILSTTLSSQEQGSFIGITLGGGYTGFNYELEGIKGDGSNQFQLGGAGKLEYSYYFSRNWGVSLGAGLSYYRTLGKYEGMNAADFFSLGRQTDDDPIGAYNDYELRVRLLNWEEQQTGYMVDVPLMLKYQGKYGKNKRHGLYFGIGAKLQIPVSSTYKILDSKYPDPADESSYRLNISGYYAPGMDMGAAGSAAVLQHGYGSIGDPHSRLGWEGDNQLKLSWSGTAELGFLIGLNRRTDLLIGGYIDYGFNDLKKASKSLMEAPASYTASVREGGIGSGITYNGLLNSDRTGKISLMSYGVQIGLKIKLGKLSEPPASPYGADDSPVIIIEKDTCCNNSGSKGIEDALNRIEEIMKSFLDSQSAMHDQPPVTVLESRRLLVVGGDTIRICCDSALPEEQERVILEHVYFDLDLSVIRPDQQEVLNRKASLMKENPGIKLRIIGNTCDLGNGVNIMLGLNRAESVKKYLIGLGISEDRLITATQGKNDPVVPNTSEPNRRQNRRCDFEVITVEQK
jgi:outer membrane protein OmpA-like peptidoglycan-associated protein